MLRRAGRLVLLWWIPASPVVGFLAAELVLSDSWPQWEVVPLAVLLAIPIAVGAFFGLQAIRHGNAVDGLGWSHTWCLY